MTKLDAGLMTSLPASDSGSAAVWGSKRINPGSQSCLCLAWSRYSSNDDDDDDNDDDDKWKTEYCENASRLRAFVPETGARPVGMGLPRAAWVKLNRLRNGVGRFHSSMHKWGLAPSPNCECGASEQTADHVLTACPIHRAPHEARGLTVLDDET